MKKMILILMTLAIFAGSALAQFGHKPVAMFKVVSDTTVINKSVGKAYH